MQTVAGRSCFITKMRLRVLGGNALDQATHTVDGRIYFTEITHVVGSHLGLRISEFALKMPSNVKIWAGNILSFDGFVSLLELQTGLSRMGVRTLFAPDKRPLKRKKVEAANSQIKRLTQARLSNLMDIPKHDGAD